MARYTVELRDVVKSGVILFDFPYDFYDTTKKADFEQKFVNHFYFREIGQETVGRFKHYLQVKFQERLPYYNELLKTSLLEFDVLKPYTISETLSKTTSNTRDLTENVEQTGSTSVTGTGSKTTSQDSTADHSETGSNTQTATDSETGTLSKTSTTEIDGKKVQSDTPNGLLSMANIKSNVYASQADVEDTTTTNTDSQTTTAGKTGTTTNSLTNDATDTLDSTISESSSDSTTGSNTNIADTTQAETGTGTENYTLSRHGHIGVQTASELLLKHVEFLKVAQTFYTQFFDECEDLFMQIY